MTVLLGRKQMGVALRYYGGTAPIHNQDKTITENGVYTADEGYSGLGTITVNVSEQAFSAPLVQEVEDEIYYSTLSKAGLTIMDVLGEDTTIDPLTNIRVYKPSTITEKYHEILTCEILQTEITLNEVLGETNE